MSITRLAEGLLTVFLGLSCVYWLPGVPIGVLDVFKTVCLFGGGGLALLVVQRRLGMRVPTGVVGLWGFLLIPISSASALFQAETDAIAVRWIYNFIIAFSTVTIMYAFARAGGDIARIVRRAALLLSVIVIVAFFLAVINYQGFLAPAEYGSRTIRQNGFAGTRAGWSVGLGVFLPVLFVVWLEKWKRNRRIFTLIALLAVTTSTLGSQLLSGGRTGLLASLVALTLLSWFLVGRRRMFVLVAGLATYVYVQADFLVSQLRLDRGGGDLDTLSSGRLGGYRLAWEAFRDRPFAGHGFGVVKDIDIDGQPVSVHNLWLALMADGGLLLVLTVTSFLIALLWRSWPLLQRRVPLWQSAPIVFIAAMVECLLEPAVLFGAFQATALFWFMAGFARAKTPVVASGSQPSLEGQQQSQERRSAPGFSLKR